MIKIDINYLKNVVKYIHFNSEKANIANAKDYKWSGYKEFFKNGTWIDKEMVLGYYDNDEVKALKQFEEQHKCELNNYYTNYSEFEIIDKLTDDEVKEIIDEKKSEIMKVNLNVINEEFEEEIIKEVINIKGVSINQICRITGIDRRKLKKLKDKCDIINKIE